MVVDGGRWVLEREKGQKEEGEKILSHTFFLRYFPLAPSQTGATLFFGSRNLVFFTQKSGSALFLRLVFPPSVAAKVIFLVASPNFPSQKSTSPKENG